MSICRYDHNNSINFIVNSPLKSHQTDLTKTAFSDYQKRAGREKEKFGVVRRGKSWLEK